MANRTNTRDRKQAEQYKSLSAENAGLKAELAVLKAHHAEVIAAAATDAAEKQEAVAELRKTLTDREFNYDLLTQQKQAVEEELTVLQAKMAAARAAVTGVEAPAPEAPTESVTPDVPLVA